MEDIQYRNAHYKLSEIKHKYGPNIHIISDPYLLTLCVRLSDAKTVQPGINYLVKETYSSLLKMVINNEFPQSITEVRTRMYATTHRGVFRGELLKNRVKIVTIAMARAGTYPSQICYDKLNLLFDPELIRQDHYYINRVTDEEEHVTGANIHGSKVGGNVDGSIMLIPDPMGATGTSISTILTRYKESFEGMPKKVISMNLMITPEFIKRLTDEFPDIRIYAVRLDRGLSSREILLSTPGENWDQEVGLNDKQYIVPGGGGFGELMNNVYV